MSIRENKISRMLAFLLSVSFGLVLGTATANVRGMDTNASADGAGQGGLKGMDGKPMRGYGEFVGPYGQFGRG
jgi:hypothetical protein